MKIAVLRPNALGDFIFVLPALQALKETFPDSELVYLGNQWHREYLRGRRTVVDRVEVVPRVLGTFEENKTFLSRMRGERFDIAFQVYGGGKWSNPFIKTIGAKKTVGLRAEKAEDLDITIPYIYYQNEYARYVEVVERVGAKTNEMRPAVTVKPTDRMEVRLKRPYAVLHPGASDPRRRWPVERFARVGDWLKQRGIEVVITGVARERVIVEKVWKTMQNPGINLCGKLSLAALTRLLTTAEVVISNDTGPYHLAYALRVPVVGIFWAGNLINGAPLFKAQARTLSAWQTTCPLCGYDIAQAEIPLSTRQKRCGHLTSFVEKVSVAAVIKEVSQLLLLSASASDSPVVVA